MSTTFITYVNDVLVKLNEVELTSANFASSRGVQTQAKNAVNQAVRFVNQREFGWPFNHSEASVTLTAGVTRYTSPSNTKHIDYATFRIKKDDTLGSGSVHLETIDYKEYLDRFVGQEDLSVTTTLNGTLNNSDTTITVASTTGFDSTGSIVIDTEEISYTGTTSTTFTGCTRGAGGTTATSHADTTTVAQFSSGGVPNFVFRTPDDRYGLYPLPDKAYTLIFDYYTFPATDMSADTDTSTIPDRFKHVVIDGAIAYMYFFRGETALYERSFALFNEGIKNMQSLLINRFDYVRSTYIPKSFSAGFATPTSF
jgi:hypothetical protein